MEDQRDTQTGRGGIDELSEDGQLDATGVYETDDDVVLYDTENPLAWVEADNTVELSEML